MLETTRLVSIYFGMDSQADVVRNRWDWGFFRMSVAITNKIPIMSNETTPGSVFERAIESARNKVSITRLDSSSAMRFLAASGLLENGSEIYKKRDRTVIRGELSFDYRPREEPPTLKGGFRNLLNARMTWEPTWLQPCRSPQ